MISPGASGMAPSRRDDPNVLRWIPTRRDLCEGNWIVTNYTIYLISGYVSLGSLPNRAQKTTITNSPAFVKYYIPTLSEFLGAFATERSISEWLYSSFTTSLVSHDGSERLLQLGAERKRRYYQYSIPPSEVRSLLPRR